MRYYLAKRRLTETEDGGSQRDRANIVMQLYASFEVQEIIKSRYS